jgi:protein-disulfide reductase (glutathione)
MLQRFSLAVVLLALCGCPSRPAKVVPTGVDWQPYEAGLRTARQESRPVCLVLSADWCPHCRNYKKVFEDPTVIALSRSFVMIRVDVDKEPQVSGKYGPDGTYVPRTFFLNAAGELDPSIHAPRPNYQYFYDELAPDSVMGGMREALAKWK